MLKLLALFVEKPLGKKKKEKKVGGPAWGFENS